MCALPISDFHAGSNPGPRADLDVWPEYSARLDLGARIDQRSAARSVVMNSALATTTPSTSAVASKR